MRTCVVVQEGQVLAGGTRHACVAPGGEADVLLQLDDVRVGDRFADARRVVARRSVVDDDDLETTLADLDLTEALDALEGVVDPVVVDDDDRDPTGVGDPAHAKGYPGASSSPCCGGSASPASLPSTRPSPVPGRKVAASNVRTDREAASARSAARTSSSAPSAASRSATAPSRSASASCTRRYSAIRFSSRRASNGFSSYTASCARSAPAYGAAPWNTKPSPKMHGTRTSSSDGRVARKSSTAVSTPLREPPSSSA